MIEAFAALLGMLEEEVTMCDCNCGCEPGVWHDECACPGIGCPCAAENLPEGATLEEDDIYNK